MVQTTVFIYTSIQDFVLFFSLLCAVYYSKKISRTGYLKLFPIYTLISLLVDLTFYYNKSIGNLEVNIFLFLEFYFFYDFFWKIMDEKKSRNLLIIFSLIYLILLSVMLSMYLNTYKNYTIYLLLQKRAFVEIMALNNIFIVIPCILYYKSLFQFPLKKFKENPIFIIVTGLLIGFSIMIPVDAMFWLIKSHNKNLFLYLYILNTIGYVIIHYHFIKAYRILA